MDGVVFNGTIKDICTTLKADLVAFGNMPISEYQVVKTNIAKYGNVAETYYRQQALNAVVAHQFGLSVEEFEKQLRAK